MKVCECGFALVGMTVQEAPICAQFIPAADDDCDDCCRYCRHGEECHLDGGKL